MRHEAVVIGLGAAGAGALWALARRGVSVVGIEQFDIAHDRGSSHGRSRLFRGGAAEGVAYVDLARRSLGIEAAGGNCFFGGGRSSACFMFSIGTPRASHH